MLSDTYEKYLHLIQLLSLRHTAYDVKKEEK